MDYCRKGNETTHSRLFIFCDKNVTEYQIEKEFSKFGTIEDIKMPLDRNTGEPRGIAYVTYSKTSEAAYALEEMNCKTMENCKRPLKVMVASDRSEIQSDDGGRYKRLFITVPTMVAETEIRQEFAKFGNVESVQIQRDRNTGDPKPFGYITYRSFLEAAIAFEQCDQKYKAVFALPKGYKRRPETSYESNINNLAMSTSNVKTTIISMMNNDAMGYTSVNFMCSPYLTQMQVKRLFDIIPGLINCQYFFDLVQNIGKGTASYSNPICAAYAVEKLNRFEYPPGVKLFVKPDNSTFNKSEENYHNMPNVVNNLRQITSDVANSSSPDLAQLADAIAEASKLIKMATAGVCEDKIPDSNDLNYCSVKLPPPQPLADIDTSVAKRCFLVCKPQPPPQTALRDIFCRFGNLINVYTLPNKTIGYARYAVAESADKAIQTLHGAEICGIRIKVLEAEDAIPAKKMRY